MESTSTPEVTVREDLVANLKHLVGDTEQLLKRATHTAGQDYDSALQSAAQQLRRAKTEFLRIEQDAIFHAKQAAHVTDRAVHEHPYAAMGVAAGIGFLLGLLISRR